MVILRMRKTSNLIAYLIQNSDFFSEDYNYIRVKSGKSKTIKYICSSGKNKFFVKIADGDWEEKIANIYKIYVDSCVSTPKIVYLKYFKHLGKTCIVSEYIEGKSLLDIMDDSFCSELEMIAISIGSSLKKFISNIDNKTAIIKDLNDELEFMKKNAYNLQHQFINLPFINLKRIFKVLEENKKYVYLTNPIFIHGDVTFNNIIIKENEIYFIDIEGGRNCFRSLNFTGNWWWTWQGENILKEQALYRGIYRGFFDDKIPRQFHKELAFTMIYTFLCRLKKYQGNIDEIQYTFLKFKDMFDQTNYFEDYYFKWF